MAHYFTPDGRAVSFDAEVKPDGSVRPRSYRDLKVKGRTLKLMHPKG